jgi:prophage antirepressor-like protein
MKDTELMTFTNDMIGELRGFIKDGEPWFLAGQVCRCLGIKNSREALRQIKEKRNTFDVKGVISNDILVESNGGKQKATIIPEKVLYELIFQSRKKKAYEFQVWVFDEVLPSIRKHGIYRTEGKLIHRSYTDTIKDKILPTLSDNGKKHVFSNYQKLINKSLGLPPKNNKDTLSPELLEKIAHRENMVNALMNEGKAYYEIKEFILKLSLA